MPRAYPYLPGTGPSAFNQCRYALPMQPAQSSTFPGESFEFRILGELTHWSFCLWVLFQVGESQIECLPGYAWLCSALARSASLNSDHPIGESGDLFVFEALSFPFCRRAALEWVSLASTSEKYRTCNQSHMVFVSGWEPTPVARKGSFSRLLTELAQMD